MLTDIYYIESHKDPTKQRATSLRFLEKDNFNIVLTAQKAGSSSTHERIMWHSAELPQILQKITDK